MERMPGAPRLSEVQCDDVPEYLRPYVRGQEAETQRQIARGRTPGLLCLRGVSLRVNLRLRFMEVLLDSIVQWSIIDEHKGGYQCRVPQP